MLKTANINFLFIYILNPLPSDFAMIFVYKLTWCNRIAIHFHSERPGWHQVYCVAIFLFMIDSKFNNIIHKLEMMFQIDSHPASNYDYIFHAAVWFCNLLLGGRRITVSVTGLMMRCRDIIPVSTTLSPVLSSSDPAIDNPRGCL